MKITELSLLALLIVPLLSGCGSDSESEPPVAAPAEGSGDSPTNGGVIAGPPPEEPISGGSAAGPIPVTDVPFPGPIYEPISTLKGSWVQECMEESDGGGSQKGVVVYNNESFQFYENYYSDNTCQNLTARVEMSGSYLLGDLVDLDSGQIATNLSQDIISFQLAYYDSNIIASLNENTVCGHSTWAVGELQELKNCNDFDFESFKKDIVNIENNQMVYGDFDFIGEGGYPTQLENKILLKQSVTNLEGEWLQECAVSGQQSYRDELEIIGQAVLAKGISYADTSCDEILATQVGTYLFELGKQRILASGEMVTEMVNTNISLHFAINDSDFITQVNTLNTLNCGVTNWLESEFKDVFDCDWVTNTGNMVFSEIIKADSNELTFGDSEYLGGDGFPTQLDSEPYVRQN